MDDLRLVPATVADLPVLVPMAVDFKIDDPEPRSARELEALRALLDEPTLGSVWMIHDPTGPIGYAILCFGYSVEYGGRDAFLDEIYILPGRRGRGLGRRTLDLLADEACARGVVALHLEVLAHEARNANLYTRAGYTDRASRLMTRRLA